MLTRMPDYYDQFRCLAGECPHTCCAKWEVVIDEDSADRYARVEGPLGDKLRSALTRDDDGDLCFPLEGERCPFLDADNLCQIHRQLGEEATSLTCREHPRFTEDYGEFQEITLSASCPAANALLLGSEAPLAFLEKGELTEEPDEDLAILLEGRRRMFRLLEDRSQPLKVRLAKLVDLAAAWQIIWEGGTWADACDASRGEEPAGPMFPDALDRLAELEILEPDWPQVLQAAKTAPVPDLPEPLLERITAYFLFRYMLKAINDEYLPGWVHACLFSVLAVERIAGVLGLPEALRRYSCELEHSGENWDALLNASWLSSVGLKRALA